MFISSFKSKFDPKKMKIIAPETISAANGNNVVWFNFAVASLR